MYPAAGSMKRAHKGRLKLVCPAISLEANPQTTARMREIHTFKGILEGFEGSRRPKGEGTWSEVGRTPSGPNTFPSRRSEVSSGRRGTFHAGAKDGSLWQLGQTVASSGSSSAQCGHTFTLATFGVESPSL
jgi:hypothetical protein